jgi:hypothetical protein
MISGVITLLKTHHFKGAGEYTEIAKGKNELGNELSKIKRRWLLKKL